MQREIGTKEIVVNGQRVTVRVFAARESREGRQSRNEDTLHAERLADVRYQSTAEDVQEWMESR